MICSECGRRRRRPRLERVRFASGMATAAAIDVCRIEVDESGEPRIVEGSAVVVGREPMLGGIAA